jgi:hypothetical protein
MMQNQGVAPHRLFITIGLRNARERTLLEVPTDIPVVDLLPDLPFFLRWPNGDPGPSDRFGLETEDGAELPDRLTLPECGVSTSDVLILAARTPQDASLIGGAQPELGEARSEPPSSIPDPLAAFLTQPHFRTDSGTFFLLEHPPILIGRTTRADMGFINLSDWDLHMIASRTHALCTCENADFFLTPFPTTNGTFLNGIEAIPGTAYRLRSHDRVQFGFHGVELTFFASA